MLPRSLLAIALLAPVLAVSPAFAGGSSTIRIEPNSYYGAVVTVEQGVRVWRPLPPTRHMIINPAGAPVSINLTDVRETVHHRGIVQNGNAGFASAPVGDYGHGYYAGRASRFHGFHRSGRRIVGGVPVRPRIVPGARR